MHGNVRAGRSVVAPDQKILSVHRRASMVQQPPHPGGIEQIEPVQQQLPDVVQQPAQKSFLAVDGGRPSRQVMRQFRRFEECCSSGRMDGRVKTGRKTVAKTILRVVR